MSNLNQLKNKLLELKKAQSYNGPFLNTSKADKDHIINILRYAFNKVFDYYYDNYEGNYIPKVEKASMELMLYAENVYGALYDKQGRSQQMGIHNVQKPSAHGHSFKLQDHIGFRKVKMSNEFRNNVHLIMDQEVNRINNDVLTRKDVTYRTQGAFSDSISDETSANHCKDIIYNLAVEIISSKRMNTEPQIENHFEDVSVYDKLMKVLKSAPLQSQIKYSLPKTEKDTQGQEITRDEIFNKILEDISNLDKNKIKSFGNQVSSNLLDYLHQTYGWRYNVQNAIFYALGYFQQDIYKSLESMHNINDFSDKLKLDSDFSKLYQQYIYKFNEIKNNALKEKDNITKMVGKQQNKEKYILLLDMLLSLIEDKLKNVEESQFNINLDDKITQVSVFKLVESAITMKSYFIGIIKELYKKIQELVIIASQISDLMEKNEIHNCPLQSIAYELEIEIIKILKDEGYSHER